MCYEFCTRAWKGFIWKLITLILKQFPQLYLKFIFQIKNMKNVFFRRCLYQINVIHYLWEKLALEKKLYRLFPSVHRPIIVEFILIAQKIWYVIVGAHLQKIANKISWRFFTFERTWFFWILYDKIFIQILIPKI